MILEDSFQAFLHADMPASFEQFASNLDVEWVDAALVDSGTATVRRRRIPSQHVVWLVIGMALFRDRCIQEVVSHLHLVLPRFRKAGKKKQDAQSYAPSAITQARYRVGAEPLEMLFAQTADSPDFAGGRDAISGAGVCPALSRAMGNRARLR